MSKKKCKRWGIGYVLGQVNVSEIEWENTLDSGKAGNNVRFRDDSDNKKKRDIILNWK